MSKNPPLPPATCVARLATDQATARRLSDVLAESFEDQDIATAAYEEADGRWTLAIHFPTRPNETAVRALVALVSSPELANALVFDTIEAKDWVAASLAGLAPVEAGRFLVHGRHDRARVASNHIGIEIEAALAFGTGHHGTTRGCLLALDALVKRRRKRRLGVPSPLEGEGREGGISARKRAKQKLRNQSPPSRGAGVGDLPLKGGGKTKILDIGTGSGVLAIAAAKTLRCPVLASDIDPLAVRVARDNARLNKAGTRIEIVHAAGLNGRKFRERGPFDIVFANILLGPLKQLAHPMARLLAPGAWVVLSGLLPKQANAALAAYRAHGLVLERRLILDDWATLVLRK